MTGLDWRPRLVALDIDGTIVDGNGDLPAEVRSAVRRVVAAGVPVVLATGRSWIATQLVVEQLGLPAGEHVASNGAVVCSYPPLEVLNAITFDPSFLIDQLRDHPSALIAVEELGVGYRVSKAFPDGELYGATIIEPLDELSSREVTRIIIRDPESEADEFLALARRLNLHGVSYFVGWSNWLDIAPEGVDKAAGLESVTRRLGVSSADVLAMGDGYNDIEMLTWAGRGVALGDAPNDVQNSADAVTGRFADGGTAAELSRWFPEG